MKSDKKMLLIRILMFIAIAYLPVYIIYFGFIDDAAEIGTFLTVITMLIPALASIAVRLITKEGVKASYLRGNFKRGAGCYALSLVYPIVVGIISSVIYINKYTEDYKLGDHVNGDNIVPLITSILFSIISAFLFAYASLGEELGWRGYLTPKLEELFGMPAALLISGVIWGMWNVPMIVTGLKFGKEYGSYPYGGIIVTCISCIFFGSFLTYLTKRSGSVYPAALCRSFTSSLVGAINIILFPTLAQESAQDPFKSVCIGEIPAIAIGVVFFIVLLTLSIRKRRDSRS